MTPHYVTSETQRIRDASLVAITRWRRYCHRITWQQAHHISNETSISAQWQTLTVPRIHLD